jgi:type VI secretion system protein VasG
MMKFLLYGVGVLISFSLTLVLALYLSGNLNQDALNRLLNREVALDTELEATATADLVGPLARELKQREENILVKEQQLAEREKQIVASQEGLQKLKDNLESIQSDINTSLEDKEKSRQLSLKTQAMTLSGMKAEKAAKSLELMTPEEAAEVLKLIEKDKDRSKIMNELGSDFATRVFRAFQEN